MSALTRKATIVVSFALLFAVLTLSTSLPIAVFAAVPSGTAQGNAVTAMAAAPVYIHFKPKDVSGSQGGSVTVNAVVKNSGTFDFTATSCNLWYRLGTSGAWTKAGSCLTSGDFPITFKAGTSSKFSDTQSVSPTFPTGVYEWKIMLVGTYNGVASKSHAGKLMVTIT